MKVSCFFSHHLPRNKKKIGYLNYVKRRIGKWIIYIESRWEHEFGSEGILTYKAYQMKPWLCYPNAIVEDTRDCIWTRINGTRCHWCLGPDCHCCMTRYHGVKILLHDSQIKTPMKQVESICWPEGTKRKGTPWQLSKHIYQ